MISLNNLKLNCSTSKSGYVLIIPGGSHQLSLIRKAREKGFKVACADQMVDCPASTEADLFFQIGLDKPDKLLNAAKKIGPCAIVTDQTDSGVVVASWLAEQLGLPGIDRQCADLFTQKHLMREFCTYHGFPTPYFKICTTPAEVRSVANLIGYPVVIKPSDSQSSKGVFRIDDDASVDELFYFASQHSSKSQVLVESFIDGPEFTVEGIMATSGHQSLGISTKTHFPNAPMVAQSLLYEPESSIYDYNILRQMHDKLMAVSGLSFGMTHAEYKLSKGVFYLIEVAARGGGTRISSDIVPWISGVDYQGLLIDSALGRPPSGISRLSTERYALLEFFKIPEGTVRSINGIEKARSFPGVADVVINCIVGQRLGSLADDTARAGFFIVLSKTRAALYNARDRVLSTVQIEVDQ